MGEFTTQRVAPGDFSQETREFGRCADVQRVFGLRRGTLYNLLRAGKIRGVLLRVKGRKSGVRLFDMNSVRQYILSQAATQQATANNECSSKAVQQ